MKSTPILNRFILEALDFFSGQNSTVKMCRPGASTFRSEIEGQIWPLRFAFRHKKKRSPHFAPRVLS
jgi:hypothetical protein